MIYAFIIIQVLRIKYYILHISQHLYYIDDLFTINQIKCIFIFSITLQYSAILFHKFLKQRISCVLVTHILNTNPHIMMQCYVFATIEHPNFFDYKTCYRTHILQFVYVQFYVNMRAISPSYFIYFNHILFTVICDCVNSKH